MKDIPLPSVTGISRESKNPYKVLISCVLSLRTKEETTLSASRRLFKEASSVYGMKNLSLKRIQRLIYPVGFYRKKAENILKISRKIIDDFSGKVPANLNDLLALKGVGRKTANLVLGLAYKIPAICVDTHVHRIANRIGWVDTKKPLQTEEALKKILPKNIWIEINTVLVQFGRSICVPVSPHCSLCDISSLCLRRGVKRFR